MFHDVVTHIDHNGIIVSPWKNVVVALQHLLSGNAAHVPSLKHLEFLDGMLRRAKEVLIHNLVWQHVFVDPDCPPALKGLAVDISVQDKKQEIYCIELKKYGLSQSLEFELTQVYGFPRAITSGKVDIRLRAYRPKLFQVDLAAIAKILQGVFPTLDTTGSELTNKLEHVSRQPATTSYPISVHRTKDLNVVAWLQGVTPRFSGSPEANDTWQFKGTLVTGQLLPTNGSVHNQLPLLQIQILPTQADPNEFLGWRRFATTTEWASVISLTSRIAREFRSQTVRNRWSDARVR